MKTITLELIPSVSRVYSQALARVCLWIRGIFLFAGRNPIDIHIIALVIICIHKKQIGPHGQLCLPKDVLMPIKEPSKVTHQENAVLNTNKWAINTIAIGGVGY